MGEQPLVSIVIPTYNCPYIGGAIESALAQTYPRTEIIVLNDGSTKHMEVIHPYLRQIRYIEKENGGTGSALNVGIRAAKGEYVAWLSSDDLYVPDKIERQLAFMLSRNADVSYSAFYMMNELGQVTRTVVHTLTDQASLYSAMKLGNVVNGCTVMIRTTVFDRVGYFDEALRGTQDYDLWCRMMEYYDFYYMSEPLVKYRMHEGMSTKKLGDTLAAERSMIQRKYAELLDRLIVQRKKL